MINRIFIAIADRQTGQISHYMVTNDPGPVIDSCDYVELDLLHQNKMTPDLPTKYVYLNGQLEALPIQQFDYQVMEYTTKNWIDPPIEVGWVTVRRIRNQLLEKSDWSDTVSAPTRLGQELHQQWLTYRQALRDITLQTNPFAIVWPTVP